MQNKQIFLLKIEIRLTLKQSIRPLNPQYIALDENTTYDEFRVRSDTLGQPRIRFSSFSLTHVRL
jgi:hypothetical protein